MIRWNLCEVVCPSIQIDGTIRGCIVATLDLRNEGFDMYQGSTTRCLWDEVATDAGRPRIPGMYGRSLGGSLPRAALFSSQRPGQQEGVLRGYYEPFDRK